ncbi:hypothetical protein Poli38472_006546 [Pythium oligandrum]|uniref:Tubulin delta chain n=1 Tax=Pythium oligandrum TaxID=41045 RepID=A0A8K1FBW7_PYTOL|nr:hypothetical protein Poli38472_006546 [Pythium oligandrum]|eukprot:TMW56536.1 hypothetical protein Poli38472_006546 [Pythium oligandrum]
MSIFVHVGQCGNQVGDAFWRLTESVYEAPATSTASLSAKQAAASRARRKETPPTLYREQLYHPQSGKARCILVDTEPKVIRSMLEARQHKATGSGSVFVPAHVHFEQSGRGNNWAMGYNLQTHRHNVLPSKSDASSMVPLTGTHKTKRVVIESRSAKQELLEMVMESLQKEIEGLDCYQGVVLMHSLGGGTGSGLGCRVLETIRDTYPRSYLTTVSIAPSCASGDTPLQNYNALFTLGHLQEYADCVIYKENDDLLRTASYWKTLRDQSQSNASPGREMGEEGLTKAKKTSLQELNALAAADVAGYLFPIVASTSAGSRSIQMAKPFDAGKLVSSCCPLPSAKFVDIRTGIVCDRQATQRKPSVGSVDPLFHTVIGRTNDTLDAAARRLLQQTTQSFPRSSTMLPCLATSAMVRGFAGSDLTEKGTQALSQQLASAFPRAAWTRISSEGITYSSYSPFGPYSGKASVSICVNNGHVRSSVRHFLDRGRRQFQAKAYVHWYTQHGLEEADFERAFDQGTKIVQEYDALLPSR